MVTCHMRILNAKPCLSLLWDFGCEATLVFAVGCQAWGHTGVHHGMLHVRPHWCLPWDVGCEAKLEFTVGRGMCNHTGVCCGTLDMRPTLPFAVGRRMHSHVGVVCQLAAGGCCCLCSHRQLPAIPEHPPGALPSKHKRRREVRWRPPGPPPAAQGWAGPGSTLPYLSFFHRKEGNRLGRCPRMAEGSLYHTLKKQDGLLTYQCPGAFL